MITRMLAVIDVVAVFASAGDGACSIWRRNTKEHKNRRLPDFDCQVRLRLGSAMSSGSRPVRRHWHGATRTVAMTHIAIQEH
jgi:hypothetical protein